MSKYTFEVNGKIETFEGNDKQVKEHICNLFGTYFWRKRVIFGVTYLLFGHVEVRKN